MSKKEILGIDEGKKVTLMFVDIDFNKDGKLYHHCFYVGKEKNKCIDENLGIYLVAITRRKSGFDDLYSMINTTVQMLKKYFPIDLSEYNEKYLNYSTYKNIFSNSFISSESHS